MEPTNRGPMMVCGVNGSARSVAARKACGEVFSAKRIGQRSAGDWLPGAGSVEERLARAMYQVAHAMPGDDPRPIQWCNMVMAGFQYDFAGRIIPPPEVHETYRPGEITDGAQIIGTNFYVERRRGGLLDLKEAVNTVYAASSYVAITTTGRILITVRDGGLIDALSALLPLAISPFPIPTGAYVFEFPAWDASVLEEVEQRLARGNLTMHPRLAMEVADLFRRTLGREPPPFPTYPLN